SSVQQNLECGWLRCADSDRKRGYSRSGFGQRPNESRGGDTPRMPTDFPLWLAWAFAEQQHGDAGIQQFADFVEDSHAAVMDDERAAYFPAARRGTLVQQRQKRRNLRDHGGNGKAVADCDLKIAFPRAALTNFVL